MDNGQRGSENWELGGRDTAAETYGLELDTLLSVGELQGKEGPVVTHVVNFVPPTRPIQA